MLLCLETATLDNAIGSARMNPMIHITVTITVPVTATLNKRQTQSLLTGLVRPGAVQRDGEGLKLYCKRV